MAGSASFLGSILPEMTDPEPILAQFQSRVNSWGLLLSMGMV